MQEALAQWEAEGLIQLEMPNDGRYQSLCASLETFAPQLVFLSGHGRFHHQPHREEPPYGEFLFESDHGSDPRRSPELASAFTGRGVGCVVLSACESGKAASDALNHGLARQLAMLGIPQVIGMRESILDRAGILFARHFCDAIARRERIDSALQQLANAAKTPPAAPATCCPPTTTANSAFSTSSPAPPTNYRPTWRWT